MIKFYPHGLKKIYSLVIQSVIFTCMCMNVHHNIPSDVVCVDSHKKQEDSLGTWTVPLIFLLELEISGVAVQSIIHQNCRKW